MEHSQLLSPRNGLSFTRSSRFFNHFRKPENTALKTSLVGERKKKNKKCEVRNSRHLAEVFSHTNVTKGAPATWAESKI